MITAATRIDDQNPWPGLGSFDEAAQRWFNGRHTETAELRRIVLEAPLTVLFGMSGLGKTSLLQAGLFPAVRKDNLLPVFVRLVHTNHDAPLIQQVTDAFRSELERQGVDAPPFQPSESLWAYLHRPGLEFWSRQNQLLTPLFVLDQFEEVFTLGADRPDVIAGFRRDLSDLVENRVPQALAARITGSDPEAAGFHLDAQRYRVLLSFREDFLPAVEGWKREVPSIMRSRLRLLPMSAAQAFDAVHRTAPHLVDESLARDIVEFVAAAHDPAGGPSRRAGGDLQVEPALLSLVCHGLNEKRKERSRRRTREFSVADAEVTERITPELLRETGSRIITDFYRNAVGDLPGTVHRFMEEQLITESGFRKQCAVEDAVTRHGLTEADLDRLVDRRLLRVENARGTDQLELTHDLLTRVVMEEREQERRRIRRRAQVIRQRRAMALGAGIVAVLALSAFGWERYQHVKEAGALDRQRDSVLQVIRVNSIRERQRDDSVALATQTAHAIELDSINGDLRIQTAVADSLRAIAFADFERVDATRQELSTILTQLTGENQARSRVDDVVTAIQLRRQRYIAAARLPDTLAGQRERVDALADSLRRDSVSLDSLRMAADSARILALRGAARAAAYVSSARLIPFDSYSRVDAFDVRQGARIAGSSPRSATAGALLGDSTGTNPELIQQPMFFSDGGAQTHWVEWEVASGTNIGSVAVFAAHDGQNGVPASASAPRSLTQLTLTLRDQRGNIIDTVTRYLPTLPYAGPEAYGDLQMLRSLSLCLTARETARPRSALRRGEPARYRLDVSQGSRWGPRIVEIDGYADSNCGAPEPGVIARLDDDGVLARITKEFPLSPVAISLIVDQLRSESNATWVTNAVRYLLATSDSAWNQQQVMLIGELLTQSAVLRRLPEGVREALGGKLARVVPAWRHRVALAAAGDAARREGPALLRSGALDDRQVLDSLAAIARRFAVAVDSVPQLAAWRAEVRGLVEAGRQVRTVAANGDTILARRRDALRSYLDARRLSSRADRTVPPDLSRMLASLEELAHADVAVCSRPVESHCPARTLQRAFAVGDTVFLTLTERADNADSTVRAVWARGASRLFGDTVRWSPGRERSAASRQELVRQTIGHALDPAPDWSILIYDSLGRLVFRYEFSVSR